MTYNERKSKCKYILQQRPDRLIETKFTIVQVIARPGHAVVGLLQTSRGRQVPPANGNYVALWPEDKCFCSNQCSPGRRPCSMCNTMDIPVLLGYFVALNLLIFTWQLLSVRVLALLYHVLALLCYILTQMIYFSY